MRPARRLWELPARHHCVLLGAAFDVRELRQLFRRAGSQDYREASDYDLHSSAVHFAREKNAFSVPAQKLLDERFRAAVLRMRDAESGAELLERWRAQRDQGEAVSAYWAALTHPACDDAADEALNFEMHMAAHHAFAERRAAARRVRALRDQVAALEADVTGTRARAAALQRENARLRTRMQGLEGALRAEQERARGAAAELERTRRGEGSEKLRARLLELESALAQSQAEAKAERRARRILERQHLRQKSSILQEPIPVSVAAPLREADLAQRRVLCVGGKTSLVPQYRAIVERAGGEFVHHDGGLEDSIGRLPALLGAADAVICLAGDCSHAAYRLAKRYCKAKGKLCALLAGSSVHAMSSCVERLPVA
jgi:hypothetical protein